MQPPIRQSRRAHLLGLAALIAVPGALLGGSARAAPKGVKGRLDEVKRSLAPGFVAGSRVHAFQSYAFVYNFANANAATQQRAVGAISGLGLTLLEGLLSAKAAPRLVVHTDPHADGRQWYGLDLVAQVGKAKITVPGGNPTDAAAWTRSTAALSAAAKLPLDTVQRGHAAWFDLARVLNGLDTEATTLIGHAFALEVLAEQTRAGQAADWFGPRPPAETLADVAAAQSLIVDDLGRVRANQAEVLALIALGNNAARPGALDALRAELSASAAALDAWRASHRQPTPEDFGVSYAMPSPESVKAVIDEQLGVVGAAVKVARGVATGDLPRTLDGLAGLAPADTKLRTVAEGVAAAANGDIAGVLGAVAELGGPDSEVGRVAGRLEGAAKLLSLLPG